jgi:hypothetical protein
MTTTVKRGAGRPAATAKRAKAAQLPTDNGYAAMKLAELRKLAREAGWSSATRMDKAGLVELLAANPDGPPAVAPKVRAAVDKSAPKVRTYRPVTPGLAGDGGAKAAYVASLLKGLGWKVKVDGSALIAERGTERLTLTWSTKGGYSAAMSSYVRAPGERNRGVLNVASALRIAKEKS